MTLMLQGGGGGAGKSREDVVTEMCLDLLSKLPKDFVKEEVRTPSSASITCVSCHDRGKNLVKLKRNLLDFLVRTGVRKALGKSMRCAFMFGFCFARDSVRRQSFIWRLDDEAMGNTLSSATFGGQ